MIENIKEHYEKISASPVELNEEHHIYIDKKTNYFYNSVTGVLKLISKEFDQDSVIEGIMRQYNTFTSWFNSINADQSKFIHALELYVNYIQFAPWVWKTWEGEKYKSPIKKIGDYATLDEFLSEYEVLKATNSIDRPKNIYYTDKIMSHQQIAQMWQDMTDIANHYGNIVHLTLERYLLIVQGLLDEQDVLLSQITDHYLWVKEHLPLFYEKYYNSKHSFQEYEIDLSLFELMAHIEEEFKKAQIEMGRCVVPEKKLLYNNLAGTKDIHVDVDDNTFITGDHKTNKDLSTYSKYDQKLLKPFDSYDDCEMVKYTFQLSIYSFICEQLLNKKVDYLYITYYNRYKKKFRVYDIEYKKAEAEYLIRMYQEWIEERKRRYLNSSLGNYIKQKIKPEWMDHFSKGFYYLIDKNKDKPREFFINHIDEYYETYKNLKLC